jgi:indole-3-glycerol phosphate synthase
MNILDTIIAYKKTEVKKRKAETSVADLEKSKFFVRNTLSLKQSLQDKAGTGIIAEFKRRSPSKDIINNDADAGIVTSGYAKNGASGLSVLTDSKFFGGSSGDLTKARINTIPILRKDFIIDEYQLIESRSIGADVILLIADVLSQSVVKRLASFAKNIGLEVLLEIHSEKEIDHITDAVDMVGINNRDLKTFEVDINTSLQLIYKIPANKIMISESGISDTKTIVTLRKAGFKGFLIGETFMKEPDPVKAFTDFTLGLKPVQK